MKRTIIAAAALTALLALSACGSDDSSAAGTVSIAGTESTAVSQADTAESSAAGDSTAAESSAAESTADESTASSEELGEPDVPADAPFAEKTAIKYNGAVFKTGDKMADIKDKLGTEARPSEKSKPCVPDAQEVENCYYPGLSVQVNYEGTIINISLDESTYPGGDGSTAGGVKLGDTIEKAKKFLGTPDEEDEFGLTYKDGEKSLRVLAHDDGKIFVITLEDGSLPF